MATENLRLIVEDLLSLKQEGGYWDFKREWYCNKSDLLHDIICMANNLVNKDCYIIVGVDEEKDFSLLDVTNDLNRKITQNLVDFLRDKKFAGGIRPTVHVQPISFGEISIDVIVIKNDTNTPYYLTEKYREVNANNIYIRIMDTNTPVNSSADKDKVEYLWRKHFRLDSSPLERVLSYLQNRDDWSSPIAEPSSIKYYKYSPEFIIEDNPDNFVNGCEFYALNQSEYSWSIITIRYHQTVLANLQGVVFDGGRYFTATPEKGFIHLDQTKMTNIMYCYYIKGTLEYMVHQFYYENRNSQEQMAYERFMKCVLLFESIIEKKEFEEYAYHNIDRINSLCCDDCIPEVAEKYKNDFRNAYGLKQLLTEFRGCRN